MSDRQNTIEAKRMNNETLSAIFAEVGKDFGYTEATAEFAVFKEFKVQWNRTYRTISFRVSDYLKGESEDAVRGLAWVLYARIGGEEASYPETLKEALLAPEFAQRERKHYLSRTHNLYEPSDKDRKSIKDAIDRLAAMKLIDPEELDVAVLWQNGESARAGSCSVLFKVISVNCALDEEGVPLCALDYAIYSQWLRIIEGRKLFGSCAYPIYDAGDAEKKFPEYERARRVINNMGLFF